jgi:hypothetical protein
MTDFDFEKWQSILDAEATISAEAAIAAAAKKERIDPELINIQGEMVELCGQYSDLDVLASEAMDMPDPDIRVLTFTETISRDCPVEAAYAQFINLSEKLIEELMAIGWGHSIDMIERIVNPIKYAYDIQNLSDMASILARTMSYLKTTCESCAHNAMKTKHEQAGELCLLTALGAGELQRALTAVCDAH